MTIERLDAVDEENKTEVVHAKFVVGADGERYPLIYVYSTDIQSIGAHSWVRKAMKIEMEGEQTGNITRMVLCFRCMPNEIEQITSGVLST